MARIPLNVNLELYEFAAGGIVEKRSGIHNGIVQLHADGRPFVTQRPTLNIFDDASVSVSDAAGRGVYYWPDVDAVYMVNLDTVYKATYAAPLAALMSSGTERVTILQSGDYLIILDQENDEGWVIDSATSTTLTEITDTDFPPKQSPALAMARGGAVIADTLFVMATNGEIWNASVSDPTAWAGTDFISAELEPDNGVFLGKHHDNLVAIGTRSMEFFSYTANPTGSPVTARQDISHQVGGVQDDCYWSEGNLFFFVGVLPSGEIGVYLMTGFQPRKVSSPTLDSLITQAVNTDGIRIVASGFSAGGHTYFLLTLYSLVSVVVPEVTLVYDATTQLWHTWELAYTGVNDFPLAAMTESSQTRAGEGILTNGDLVTVADDFNPQDLTLANVYVEDPDDYVVPVYISDTGQSGDDVTLEAITGPVDVNTRRFKFASDMRLVADLTEAAQSATLQWADDDGAFNTGKTLAMEKAGSRVMRGGRFRKRNFKITVTADEVVRAEALEMDIALGDR